MPRTFSDHLDPLVWKRDSPPSPQPDLVARQVEGSQKKPRPAGETGRGLGVRSLSRIKCAGARTIVQAD